MIQGTCSSCGAEDTICDGCFNCGGCGCQCDKAIDTEEIEDVDTDSDM